MSLISLGQNNRIPRKEIEIILDHNNKIMREFISIKRNESKLIDATNRKKTRSLILTTNGYLVLSSVRTSLLASRIGLIVSIGHNNYIPMDKIHLFQSNGSRPVKEFISDKKLQDEYIDTTRAKKTKSIIITNLGIVVGSYKTPESLSKLVTNPLQIGPQSYTTKDKVEIIIQNGSKTNKGAKISRMKSSKIAYCSYGKSTKTILVSKNGFLIMSPINSLTLAKKVKNLVSIGNNNYISEDTIELLLNKKSNPINRYKQIKQEHNDLFNATHGKKSRSLLITHSGFSILSSLSPTSLSNRFTGLVNVGNDNYIPKDNVNFILPKTSRPLKKQINIKKLKGYFVDTSFGKPSRAILITQEGFAIDSSLSPRTLFGRFNIPFFRLLDSYIKESSIVAILPPQSTSTRKHIEYKRAKKKVVDITKGKRTRAAFLLEDETVVLSPVLSKTSADKLPKFIHLGFGNYVSLDKTNSIYDFKSRPIKNYLHKKRMEEVVYDSSNGRVMKSVLLIEHYAFISSLKIERIISDIKRSR